MFFFSLPCDITNSIISPIIAETPPARGNTEISEGVAATVEKAFSEEDRLEDERQKALAAAEEAQLSENSVETDAEEVTASDESAEVNDSEEKE